MTLKRLAPYAPLATRLGISFVVLWFGINQLINPKNFMGYLPNYLLGLNYAETIIQFNGLFETIFGGLLLAGYLVRPVALILSIHLLSIAFTLGYNDIAIRDIALAIVTFGIFLGGKDKWCLRK